MTGFIDSNCVLDNDSRIVASDLYNVFRYWLKKNNIPSHEWPSNQKFYTELETRGYIRRTCASNRMTFVNLKLNEDLLADYNANCHKIKYELAKVKIVDQFNVMVRKYSGSVVFTIPQSIFKELGMAIGQQFEVKAMSNGDILYRKL